MVVVTGTKNTPQVDFENTLINIEGRLIPTDYEKFYSSLGTLIGKLNSKKAIPTTININLDFINASSKKFMVDTFGLFEKKHEKGNRMVINWYYKEGDEDMYDLGLIYKSIINIPFKLIEIKKGDQ
jgi:hypothetical protein